MRACLGCGRRMTFLPEGFWLLRLVHQKMRARLGCGRRLAFLPDGFWSLARWTGDARLPGLRPPIGFSSRRFLVTGALDRGCELASAAAADWPFFQTVFGHWRAGRAI